MVYQCCKFIQYMPNQPDKFGIKFWIYCDVKNKFRINQLPYQGTQDKQGRAGEKLGDYVVKPLRDPFLIKGYNVTVDNFFTSHSLAHYLLTKRTTRVGTVRQSCPFLYPAHKSKKNLHESQFFSDDNGVLTVSYQIKNSNERGNIVDPALLCDS